MPAGYAQLWFLCVACGGVGRGAEENQGPLHHEAASTTVAAPDPDVLEAGVGHACARDTDRGSIACWGENPLGQLGARASDTVTPVRAGTLSDVRDIGVGAGLSCVCDLDGRLECWGNDGASGNMQARSVDVPQCVAVEVGGHYACSLGHEGTLHCFGRRIPLLSGATDDSWHEHPRLVRGIGTVAQFDAGRNHACAVTLDGDVVCWGDNHYGQVSQDVGIEGFAMVPLSEPIERVGVGDGQSCVIARSGRVVCWGFRYSPECYDVGWPMRGATLARCVQAPTEVNGIADRPVSIAVGGGRACVVTRRSSLVCWGVPFGHVTNAQPFVSRPATVIMDRVRAVTLVGASGCVMGTSGEVRCWGILGGAEYPEPGDARQPPYREFIPPGRTIISARQ
jgi:hypothetical protein